MYPVRVSLITNKIRITQDAITNSALGWSIGFKLWQGISSGLIFILSIKLANNALNSLTFGL